MTVEKRMSQKDEIIALLPCLQFTRRSYQSSVTWNRTLLTMKFVNLANFLAVKTKRSMNHLRVFLSNEGNKSQWGICGIKVCFIAFKVEVSPLENAIQVVENKNQELRTLISQYQHKQMHGNINLLSMCLNGVIDAAVNGGIARYQEVSEASEYTINVFQFYFHFCCKEPVTE